MGKDITVHFVGNARDLAASSAVATASVDRFGNATATAGAEAEVASLGFYDLLLPLILIAAAALTAVAPIVVLAATFGGLAAGVVALAAVTGHLNEPLAKLVEHARAAADALGAKAAPMAAQLLAIFDRMIPVIAAFGSQLLDWFGARLPAMLPIVTQIVKIATGAVLAFFQAWGNMVDWFMAHWEGYSAAIGAVFDQIGTGVHFALPLLGLMHEAFVRLGPVIQFIRDHADSLKPVLYAVGALFVVMAASAMLTVAALLLLVAAITAVAAGMSWAISHIHAVADAFWAVVHAAQAAAGAIRNAAAAAASVPLIGGVLGMLGVGRQHGGPVLPGGIYTVGEAGPETLFMGGAGGYVVPGRMSAGGGATYNINVSVSPTANLADIGRTVVGAIQEYERGGGKAWRL